MKTLQNLIAAGALALLAAAFGSAQAALAQAVKPLGSVDLPDKPGYSLRGYRLDNGFVVGPHYVYILERAGEPVAGTGSSFQAGKTRQTTELLMTAPSGATVTCVGITDCEKALSIIKQLESGAAAEPRRTR